MKKWKSAAAAACSNTVQCTRRRCGVEENGKLWICDRPSECDSSTINFSTEYDALAQTPTIILLLLDVFHAPHNQHQHTHTHTCRHPEYILQGGNMTWTAFYLLYVLIEFGSSVYVCLAYSAYKSNWNCSEFNLWFGSRLSVK